jgi:hypothetical protein
MRSFIAISLVLVGCGGDGSKAIFGGDPDASDSGGTDPNPDSGGFNIPEAGDTSTGPVDSSLPEVAVVYAHSPSDLYKLDPTTKAITHIGPFSGCSSVIDLALDANSNAFVTTFGGVYTLNLKTAACTLISTGSYPNSLSFVPKGTLDATQEALVGYLGATYVRIDTKTGAVTNVGALTGGYSSSGDIVSVNGGGTFLTVNGNGCGDCLLQVNPKTGDMIKSYGTVNHSAVYGIAYWGGALYGFDNAGEIFEITAKGSSITTTPVTVPPGLQWWGAGSTTSAPVADQDGGTIPIN